MILDRILLLAFSMLICILGIVLIGMIYAVASECLRS